MTGALRLMATANLKSKISLDDTQFSAGLRRVKLTSAAAAKQIGTSFRKLGGIMANLARSLARFAAIAGAITFAAAVAGAVKLGNALKKAFDAGGALSDLSAQTGIAVKQLAILQQAFEDNGVSADQVGTVVNKLQRSISDFGNDLSTQVRAFERLGISYDAIKSKTPLQQFQMVQQALAKMEDPTARAATAMEIFGRSGGNMLALFQDGNAISNAMVTVGSAADLLDKNAGKFDRISDLLNSAGSKLQGFFVGVGDVAADKILPVLEKFNAIDFAAMGQNFAQNFNLVKLNAIFTSGLKLAAEVFQDGLIKAVTAAFVIFEKLFSSEGREILGNSILRSIGIVDANDYFEEQRTGRSSTSVALQGLIEETLQELAEQVPQMGTGEVSKKFRELMDGVSELFLPPKTSNRSSSESNLYDQELEEQRKRVAKEVAFMNYEEAGPAESLRGSPPTPISPMQATAMQMSTAAGAGFTGLAGLYGMQIERMAGIAPGANGVFARDRNRLGIASGLRTGGLGEVRKVGAKADQKAARKDDTIIGTNDRLTTANEKLQTQIELLQEALA